MKLAMIQSEKSKNMQENLESDLSALYCAAANNADLVLFPELQLTEFFPQYPGQDANRYRMHAKSTAVQAFCAACREHRIMAAPNFYWQENGKSYDATLLISQQGEILGIQKMVHIAQAPRFYEQDYYTPSDTGFQVFDTSLGRIGIVVCFDRHYPESIRSEALMGADLILIPTANTKQEPLSMFEKELQVQAFQNSVFLAMCNRTGTEGQMDFAGESLAVSPAGVTLCKADDRPRILYTEFCLSEAARVRREKPYTSLRRTDLYL